MDRFRVIRPPTPGKEGNPLETKTTKPPVGTKHCSEGGCWWVDTAGARGIRTQMSLGHQTLSRNLVFSFFLTVAGAANAP